MTKSDDYSRVTSRRTGISGCKAINLGATRVNTWYSSESAGWYSSVSDGWYSSESEV